MHRGWALTLAVCMLLVSFTPIQTASGWMVGDIDLANPDATANITAICGINTGWRAGDNAGEAVLCADINGDGFDDIIIGAPYAAPEFQKTTDSGLVHIIYGGKPLGPVFNLGDCELTLYGPVKQMLLGHSLAAGDVNGDHIQDLIIGAPGYSTLDIRSCGAIFVILGSATTMTGLKEVFSTAAMNATGLEPYMQLGASVAAGDVDGDGMDDVLAGATEMMPEKMGISGPGVVHVAFGHMDFNATTAFFNLNISGQRPGEGLGSSLSCADLNDDERGDIIIGAPYYTPYLISPELGKTYCILGSSNLTGNISVSKAELTVTGTESGGRLGWSVLPVDLDNDQNLEIAISAPLATGKGKESGVVLVFKNGLSGDVSPKDAKWTLLGQKLGSHSGMAMAMLELSGATYLAIGAPGSNGSSSDGASKGELTLIRCSGNISQGTKDIPALASMTIYGGSDGDGLGGSAASGRGLDGHDEGLLISAPTADGANGESADCGVTYLFWASPKTVPDGPQDQDGNITLPETNDWKDWMLVGGLSATFFVSMLAMMFLIYRSKKKHE